MMKSLILLLISNFFISYLAISQKEDWLWYNEFGGLTFNTSDTSPKFITNSRAKGERITATIADKDANLLFYTDGDTVWNRNHKIMPNGVLSIDEVLQTNKPNLVCNMPGNKNMYYLIYTAGDDKCYYAIIDMKADAGFGDVTKMKILIDSNVRSFNVIYHSNGIDLWLLTYSAKDTLFKCFLITKNGINKNPLILPANKDIKKPDVINRLLHVSPDGKKIVNTQYYRYDIYRFDNYNGYIEFQNSIYDSSLYFARSQPISFSSNSQFLYIFSYQTPTNVDSSLTELTEVCEQYFLLEDKNRINLLKNIVFIESPSGYLSGHILKLAPNRKIYIGNIHTFVMGEITFPDSLGLNCQYKKNAIRIPVRWAPLTQNYIPCYYCFYATVNKPICEGDTIYFEGNLSARFVNPEFYWTGPNGFVSNERNPIIPNAKKIHSGLYRLTVKADTTILYDTVYVNIFDQQTAKIKAKNSLQLCRNGTIELESELKDSKVKYLWSNGKTTDKISVSKGGIYKLIITNENGCIGIDSVEVLDPPSVNIESNKTGLCYGEAAILRFNTNTEIKNIRWSNGSTDSSIRITLPGRYKLYYEYGDCNDSSEITIEDYGKIGARIEGDSIVCQGDSVWLRAMPQGYNYKYQWSNGSRDYEIKTDGTQRISVIIENQNGCLDTAYFELKEIPSTEAKIKGGSGLCPGQKKILKAEPNNDVYKYKWSTGDTTNEITVTTAGIYYLEVSLKGKCKSYDTIIVVEAEAPTPQMTGNPYICFGGTEILTVTQDFVSYQWSTGETTRQITIDKAGIYSVTVIDTNGCEGRATFEVKEFSVQLSGIKNEDFGRISIGGRTTSRINIKNESNTDLEISDVKVRYNPNIFNITTKPNLPHILKENEELEITIIFNPNEVKKYEDTLIIETGKPCQDIFATHLTGEGINFTLQSKVWLPDTSAEIGTIDYKIPLRAKIMQDTTLSNLKYNVEIGYDASYYQPERITVGNLETNTIENGERVLKISGSIPVITAKETILTELSGLVLLGKPEPAILRIISFEWMIPEINIEKQDGSLTVTGVCNQSFSNLVLSDNLSIEIRENPVESEMIIRISGKSKEESINIQIYNILGVCVLTTPSLRDTPSEKGNVKIDVSQLPAGVYFVRVGDWVGRFVKI